MTKPITNLNDAFDLCFEGGTVRLRLKEGITRETWLDEGELKRIQSADKMFN